MQKAKVAVVGCGYWGKNLVRNFSELGALAAVVDGSQAIAMKIAETYGVPALGYEDVLASEEITGVVISVPAEAHAALVIRALEAGKHVYVEKPIALSLEDAYAMKAASDASGKILMVGHLLRYHPAFEALLELVNNGLIGTLKYAYSHRLSLGKFRVEENALWSFAPHDVSMLLALFGQSPTNVQHSGGSYIVPGIEDENRVEMTFANGSRAHVFVSWLHPFKEHRLVVIGEAGMVVFEDSAKPGEKLRLYRHVIDTSGWEPIATKAEPEIIMYEEGEPLRRECQHFLDCCATGQKPRTDADEAIAVLRVLTAQ